MKNTPDGAGGTLLDNMMICYGSSLGDANIHTHHDLPTALVAAARFFKGNRHLQYSSETPLDDLFVKMLNTGGVPCGTPATAPARLATYETRRRRCSCATAAWLLPRHRRPAIVNAVKRRDPRAVESLLAQKADANTTAADGASALAWAIHLGDHRAAELLLRYAERVRRDAVDAGVP